MDPMDVVAFVGIVVLLTSFLDFFTRHRGRCLRCTDTVTFIHVFACTKSLHRQTPRSSNDTDKEIGGTRLKPKEHVSGELQSRKRHAGKDTSALSVSQRFRTFLARLVSPSLPLSTLVFSWSHQEDKNSKVLAFFFLLSSFENANGESFAHKLPSVEASGRVEDFAVMHHRIFTAACILKRLLKFLSSLSIVLLFCVLIFLSHVPQELQGLTLPRNCAVAQFRR
jgi:hypothetical protein